MAKRIFKVIGIVLAGVLGLAGGIVGVLAIMGKFKTPVVYPKQLVFAEPEMVVEDYNNYELDEGTNLYLSVDKTENINGQVVANKGIYSFYLNGVSGEDHEVTKTDCLLTITSGANLIQLCDENGDTSAVEKINGKYKIKCNENTYFRLKAVDNQKFTGLTYGKIVLKAEDERMMASTGNNGLTIWVDRVVKKIGINNDTPNKGETKSYQVGLEEGLAFDAVSSPAYALNPISKTNFGGKIVEYYYFDRGAMTESGALTEWTLINVNDLSKYPFLYYNQDENMLYFRADTTDLAGQTYKFRVATFETYSARERYLASIEGREGQISNLDRMAEMVWSAFDINVKSTKITEIGSETANIDLSLFEQNNNLVMSADVDGGKNLRLYMKGAGTRTYSRFYEADFDLRTINLLRDAGTGALVDINTVWFKSCVESDFTSGNVARLNLNTKVGNTFLDFFVYDATTQSYRLATKQEFDYTATHIDGTNNENRAFNVAVKSLPNLDGGLQLVLGAMVVNNSGEYYFTSIDVSVAENDLNFTYIDEKQEHTLNVQYNKDRVGNYTVELGSLNFEDVVEINTGSYRACVFVTPKNAENEYDVEVLPNIVYTKVVNGETKEYVLVGYFAGGKFVNQIKAKNGAKNVGTKLYLLQLKNNYDSNFGNSEFDAAEMYINSIFTETIYNINTQQYETIFNYDESEAYTIGKDSEIDTVLINGDKGERFIDSNRMLVINIKYILPENEIVISNFKSGVSNNLVNQKPNRVDLIAGFTYIAELNSSIPNLLKNIFNANVDGVENFKQYLNVVVLDQNGNIVENDSKLNITDVVLNLNTTAANEGEQETENATISVEFELNDNADSAAATNPRTYKLVFEYGDVKVESNLIYAVSDKPTKISLAYVTIKTGEDEDLVSETVEVDLNRARLNIEIGCEENAYTYTYTLTNTNGGLIYNYGKQFALNNYNTELTEEPSFYVSPAYRDLHEENKNEILYSIQGVEGYVNDLTGLSVGNYSLIVSTYGGLVDTLNVVVSAPTTGAEEIFQRETSAEVVVKDSATYKLNVGNASQGAKGVGYAYGKAGEALSYLPSLVNISSIEYGFSGSESLELVKNIDENKVVTEYVLRTINSNEDARKTVLTISRDVDGDWTFVRGGYANTSLVVTLGVSMDTFADDIEWKITFTSSRQIDKNKAWAEIYADTQIQFFEAIDNNTKTDFATNALFQITDVSNTTPSFNIYKLNAAGTYEICENRIATDTGIGSLEAGNYMVEFVVGDGASQEILASFPNIVVYPNVFASWKINNLISETTYNLTDLATLQKYKSINNNGRAYGETITNLIYNQADLEGVVDFANFDIDCNVTEENSTNKLVTMLADKRVQVGYIKDLFVKDLNNATDCIISLKYNDDVVGSSQNISIKNKYTIKMTADKMFMVNRDSLVGNVGVTENDIDVLATNVDVVVGDYELTAAKVITNNIAANSKVDAAYTFTINGKEYVYTTEITLLPYVPATVSNSNTTETYSQSTTFDIINSVFGFNYNNKGVITDINIKNIYVDSVLVDGVESYIYFANGQNFVKGVGYFSLNAAADNVSFVTAIGAISGASKSITINYHIDYVGGDNLGYIYSHTLVINNYLSAEAKYPFVDDRTKTNSQLYMVAVDGKAVDVEAFGGSARGNNIYSFASGLDFEPVTIGQIVDMSADSSLDIRRTNVKNLVDNSQAINAVASVELVAFESSQKARYYVNGGGISINGTTIKFNASELIDAGTNAYFLFKVYTTSGNYCFYLVKLHKQSGSLTNISLADVVNEVEVDGSTTEIGIVPTDWTAELGGKTLTELYGITSTNNLNYYLLSIKANGNTDIAAFDYAGIKGKDATDLFDADSQYKKLALANGKFEIANPNKFVQIKVGIVYSDDNVVAYIGSYTTSISVTNNLNIYDKTNNPNGLLSKKAGEFGRYTATLTELATDQPKSILAENVTGVNVKIESVNLTGTTANKFSIKFVDGAENVHTGVKIAPKDFEATNFIEIDGANIKVNTFITNDLTFTVKFDVAGAIVIVDFTFNAVIVDQIGNVVLGSFDTSTGFNTILDLTSRIGNYKGQIEYADTFNAGTNGEYNAADNLVDYSATQTTKTNQGVATLTLSNLLDIETNTVVKRQINVTVYPAYHVEQSMGGGTESSPYLAQATNNYQSPIGSKVTINKEDHSALGYITYIMRNGADGGLKIYVKADTTLKFMAGTLNAGTDLSENCAKYVVTDETNGAILTIDGNIVPEFSTESTAQIGFVHMAQSKTVLLTISLLNNGEEVCDRNNSSKALSINFFVTLPSTYTNLKANYTVAKANHDNFVAGSNQENVLAYLFGNAYGESANENNIYSLIRMSLVAGVNAENKDNIISVFNAEKMGFLNINNPNHINLVLGDSLRSEANADNGDYKLIVGAVSNTTQTWLRLNNVTGLESDVYMINILTEADKLIYQADIDDQTYLTNHSKWAADGINQYASVVINDKDKEAGFNYASNYTQNKIAKIYDVNNNVFKIVNKTAKVNGVDATTYTLAQSVDENGEKVEGSYILTVAQGQTTYKITIYRSENREIMFNISREANSNICKNLVVLFDIYSNSSLICANFTLNIYNYNIASTENEYFATEQFSLADLLTITDNSSNANTTVDNLTYDLVLDANTSYYVVNGQRIYVTKASNNLFEYNKTNKTITTYQVPEQVQLTAYIKVSAGDYVVDIVRRVVTIKRNIQFKVNGSEVAPGSQFNTNYNLADSGNYIKNTSNKIIGFASPNLVRDLGLTLNYVKNDTEITALSAVADIKISQVEVADYTGNVVANYVELTEDNSLVFKRDFTGTITISLGYRTNSGYFYQYWDIYVTGLQTFVYANNPTYPLVDNGISYTSGQLVKIVNPSQANTPAIVANSNISSADGVTVDYEILAEYLVLDLATFNNNVNMEYLLNASNFDNSTKLTEFDGKTFEDTIITKSLPLVPQSKADNPIDYYVIYRFVYKYAGEKLQPYFAIYKVRNVATVTLAPNVNTSINVDDNNNPIYNADDKSLNLFYLAETFSTAETGITTIQYIGGGYYLLDGVKVDGTVNNSVLTITKDLKTYVFDYSTTATLTIGDKTYERSSISTYFSDTVKTMFNCDYTNTLRFKDFVDGITKITINDVEYVSANLIGSETTGVISLDLASVLSSDKKLFINNAETQLKIFLNGNSAAMDAFEISLTGNQTITPKGKLWISQIFQDGGYTTDYQIVGISAGSADANWFNNAKSVDSASNSIYTFNIGNAEYNIYQVIATGTGNQLYDVTATFNYLSGASEIYAIDYLSRGESNCFRVQYIEGKDSTINLSTAVKKYYNNGDGALCGAVVNNVTINASNLNIVNSADISNVNVAENDLIQAKQSDKDATYIMAELTLSQSGLVAVVRFDLPELTYIVNYAPTTGEDGTNCVLFNLSTVENDIASCRNILLYNEDDKSYVSLTSDNQLVMDTATLLAYKTANSNAQYMKVNYKLSYTKTNSATGEESQVEIEFAVRWNVQ